MKKLFLTIFSLILFLSSSKAQVADKAENISPLLIGEKIPEATLTTTKGENIQLSKIISEKPSVVIFYRGGWCPFCNMHLAEIGKVEKEILDLGYQIVAISPDDYVNLQGTSESTKLNYQIYSDAKGDLLKSTGIAFQLPQKYKEYLPTKTKGKVTEVLPVPTMMVVDKKGTILFEYINPDFKQRISGKLLLAVLKNLEIK
jgi:peroxiredoxin